MGFPEDLILRTSLEASGVKVTLRTSPIFFQKCLAWAEGKAEEVEGDSKATVWRNSVKT